MIFITHLYKKAVPPMKEKKTNILFRIIRITAVILGAYLYSAVLTRLIDISAAGRVNASFDTAEVSGARIRAVITEEKEVSLSSLSGMYQKKYLNRDTEALRENRVLSGSSAVLQKREMVYVMETGDEYSRILTGSGSTGYIRTAYLNDDLRYIFDAADTTKYAKEKTILRNAPYAEGETVEKLSLNTKVHITGTNDETYWQAEYKGNTVYVRKEDLMDSPKVIAKPVVQKSSGGGTIGKWDGRKLTRRNGTIMGPSGKETWYNLKMSYVVKLMHKAGFKGEYWVREDGVKMFGDYVMVAADLSIRPKGTILPTSLGMGIVCDTGTFIYTNKYQIDIAVAW